MTGDHREQLLHGCRMASDEPLGGRCITRTRTLAPSPVSGPIRKRDPNWEMGTETSASNRTRRTGSVYLDSPQTATASGCALEHAAARHPFAPYHEGGSRARTTTVPTAPSASTEPVLL